MIDINIMVAPKVVKEYPSCFAIVGINPIMGPKPIKKKQEKPCN